MIFFWGCVSSQIIAPMQTKATLEDKNSVLDNTEFLDNIAGIPISLVAPASKVPDQNLKRLLGHLKPFSFHISETAQGGNVPYHAHEDEKRAELLTYALLDPTTQAVWALRGGYGTARLYKYLSPLQEPPKKKLLIGYSDLTFVHLFLTQKWNWPSIHGAMAAELLSPGKNPDNFLILSKILAKKINHLEYSLTPLNEKAKNITHLSGLTTGGNMTLLLNSLGTPWQAQTKNKIVLIEDTFAKDSGAGYQIDRGLNQLDQAGLLDQAKAVILGTFTQDTDVDFALERFIKNIDAPVFKATWFGHQETNYPVVMNWKWNIICRGNCVIETDLTGLIE